MYKNKSASTPFTNILNAQQKARALQFPSSLRHKGFHLTISARPVMKPVFPRYLYFSGTDHRQQTPVERYRSLPVPNPALLGSRATSAGRCQAVTITPRVIGSSRASHGAAITPPPAHTAPNGCGRAFGGIHALTLLATPLSTSVSATSYAISNTRQTRSPDSIRGVASLRTAGRSGGVQCAMCGSARTLRLASMRQPSHRLRSSPTGTRASLPTAVTLYSRRNRSEYTN